MTSKLNAFMLCRQLLRDFNQKLHFIFSLQIKPMKNFFSKQIWNIGVVTLTLPVLIPIFSVIQSLASMDSSSWSHFTEHVFATYAFNTLTLLSSVACITLVLGVLAAWLVSYYEFPGRSFFTFAMLLPLAAPTYIVGYVYADLLDFYGPIQSTLRDTFGLTEGEYFFPSIRSLPGAAVILSFVLYPYIYLLVKTSFDLQAPDVRDAAIGLGAKDSQVLIKIDLPIARPAIAGGLALVLMETAAEYGLIHHFGVPTFTEGIFRSWYALGDRTLAMQLASCLFIIAGTFVVLERAARKGERSNPVRQSSLRYRRKPGIIATGLILMFCITLVVLGFLIPFFHLTHLTFFYGSFNYDPKLLEYISNSFYVASIAAALCLIVATTLCCAIRFGTGYFLSGAIHFATLGYAIPGMVLAVGLIGPISWIYRYLSNAAKDFHELEIGLILTGSITALLLLYMARFLTVGFNSMQSGFEKINPTLDAAGKLLGAQRARRLRDIHIPLVLPSLLTGYLLVFLDVIKELPGTLILRPFNFETLATRTYRMASDERLAEASSAALTILVLALLPTMLLLREDFKAKK